MIEIHPDTVALYLTGLLKQSENYYHQRDLLKEQRKHIEPDSKELEKNTNKLNDLGWAVEQVNVEYNQIRQFLQRILPENEYKDVIKRHLDASDWHGR